VSFNNSTFVGEVMAVMFGSLFPSAGARQRFLPLFMMLWKFKKGNEKKHRIVAGFFTQRSIQPSLLPSLPRRAAAFLCCLPPFSLFPFNSKRC
jgi:hypothetical protein